MYYMCNVEVENNLVKIKGILLQQNEIYKGAVVIIGLSGYRRVGLKIEHR
jgi:hypothetical protein